MLWRLWAGLIRPRPPLWGFSTIVGPGKGGEWNNENKKEPERKCQIPISENPPTHHVCVPAAPSSPAHTRSPFPAHSLSPLPFPHLLSPFHAVQDPSPMYWKGNSLYRDPFVPTVWTVCSSDSVFRRICCIETWNLWIGEKIIYIYIFLFCLHFLICAWNVLMCTANDSMRDKIGVCVVEVSNKEHSS